MKNITLKLALAAWLLPIITACTPITVVPLSGGMYSVITTSNTEEQATQSAKEKAQSICKTQQGRLSIIDKDVRYQGVDKNQQQLINLANKILPTEKQTTPYTQVDYEYKTTLVFRCE
jgi:hypothetical protein